GGGHLPGADKVNHGVDDRFARAAGALAAAILLDVRGGFRPRCLSGFGLHLSCRSFLAPAYHDRARHGQRTIVRLMASEPAGSETRRPSSATRMGPENRFGASPIKAASRKDDGNGGTMW